MKNNKIKDIYLSYMFTNDDNIELYILRTKNKNITNIKIFTIFTN